MKTCLNCASTVNQKFCGNCGQKISTERLNTHQIIHDIQHSIFHYDKGIFYNLGSIFQPQRILEYIDGKRVKFFNPVVYLILVSGILAVVVHYLFGVETSADQATNLLEHETNARYNIGHAIGHIASTYGKYLTAFSIFPFALSSLLVFRNARLNYWEHLYISIFIIANFTVFCCAFLPAWALSHVSLNFLFVYYPITMFWCYQVFKRWDEGLKLLGKSLLVATLGLVFYVLFLAGVGIAGALVGL